jgi:putative copper resistance protein D
MDRLLIAARLVHYASTIALAGYFGFLCFVADPDDAERLRRRLSLLAWASLLLALVSGGAWLLALAAGISGKPLDAVLLQGIVPIVLARTRFGQTWLIRFVLVVLLAIGLLARQRWRGPAGRWTGLALGGGLLASLAWAGHGGATPGRPGDLHLAADMLHLLAAGAWLGSLIPLALLLAEARWIGDPGWAALARRSVLRFSVLAAASVGILFAAGLVNTWFLAGTVPALIGTAYGRLLLAKIAIFAIMVVIAAVNLLRMTPRLAPASRPPQPLLWAAVGHLRRNALIEAGLGLAVLAIVAILGILPPGLHTEPGWPLSFRLELGALALPSKVVLAVLAGLAAAAAIAGVAAAAAGRYRRATMISGGFVLCLAFAWIALRPAIEPAYPTSFYAPAEPYAAASVVHGARLYVENCAFCHGAAGTGNGAAAAGLTVRPADLTAPHLFAHTEGDLFWWVSHGRGNGAMPGFAGVMSPAERWDVINFIRARAAGVWSRRVGPEVSAAAPAIPDFAFETGGAQQTLGSVLQGGPAFLALLTHTPAAARLAQLTAAQNQAAAGLRILAVALAPAPPRLEAEAPAPLVGVAADVAASLALFRAPDDGGETDLLLDRAGQVRARWTRNGPVGLPDAVALLADAAAVARLPSVAVNHAGHVH